MTLFRKLADREDGRLMSQNNHVVGAWVPGFFYRTRERSSKELKLKGRIERGEVKFKGPLVLQKVSENGQYLGRDVLISSSLRPFTGGQGQIISLELNKDTLVYQSGRGAGSSGARPLCMILTAKQQKASQRSSSNMKLELTLLYNTRLPCNTEVEKE